MQTYPYGAHEVMELHEVLNASVDALNTIQLYLPYVRDPELGQMIHHHLQFMQSEYNNLVHLVHGIGIGAAVPYRSQVQVNLQAGTQLHQPVQPNATPAQMDDRDVASALLGLHKAGAKLKLEASLEAAHPQIRNILQQGAINCANQAYEVWGYMMRKGLYPLATLPESANALLLRGYQPVAPEMIPAAYPIQAAMPTGGMPMGGTLSNSVEPAAVPSLQPGGVSAVPFTTPSPQPSVNASYIFSSPVYREAHQVRDEEQQTMGTELSQTTSAIDPLTSWKEQPDTHQQRKTTRKKGN